MLNALMLMLMLAVFSVMRVSSLSKAFQEENRIFTEKPEPLYVAREVLAQTGLAARNAYIFEDNDRNPPQMYRNRWGGNESGDQYHGIH